MTKDIVNVVARNTKRYEEKYKYLDKHWYLEYLSITISDQGLHDTKCYFQLRGNLCPDELYNYSEIKNVSVKILLRKLLNDQNLQLLDMSFNDSAISSCQKKCRFTFTPKKHHKEAAKPSIFRAVKLLRLENHFGWMNLVAEILEAEMNNHKYPLYAVGFSYDLQKQMIDASKIYFLGRTFISANAHIVADGIYDNDLARNALTKISYVISPELDKNEILYLFDRINDAGFGTLTFAVNMDREMNREFKVYFKILDAGWNRDGGIKLLADYSNPALVENIFQVIEGEGYSFEGFAVAFLEKRQTAMKLYFRPEQKLKAVIRE